MKETLHQIAVFVPMSIIGSVFSVIAAWRDCRLSAHGMDVRDQRIRIVSLVTNDRLGAQALDQGTGLGDIGHLTSRQ